MKPSGAQVVVGMSGGVDSSVAAALLRDQGYDPVGCSLRLLTCHREAQRSCCSARDRQDARAVCEKLGMRHRTVEARGRFRDEVIEPFIREYLAGRTPSPCVRCNRCVKFPALLEEADRLGAKHIATGHYARVVEEGGRFRLLAAADPRKDQSYFLFELTQATLARLLLPLGGLRKPAVRSVARRLGLPVSEKPESQEVCFVPGDDYAAFVEERGGKRVPGPGTFVDAAGNEIGRHRGFHAYTIGQRRGLGVAFGRRAYVTAIDAVRNQVRLGADEELSCSVLIAEQTSWTHPEHALAREAVVRIRSTHEGTPARFEPLPDGRVRVRFAEPVRAIAPGQAAVFYQDDEVIGGAWIEAGSMKQEA